MSAVGTLRWCRDCPTHPANWGNFVAEVVKEICFDSSYGAILVCCVSALVLFNSRCYYRPLSVSIPEVRGNGMTKEVVCPPCGEAIRGDHDDELVANVINHAKVHGHELHDTDRSQILSEAREI